MLHLDRRWKALESHHHRFVNDTISDGENVPGGHDIDLDYAPVRRVQKPYRGSSPDVESSLWSHAAREA
jgi:hypothetical protein